MEKLKAKRKVLRINTTKLINKIEDYIKESEEVEAQSKINILREFREQLIEKENNIKKVNSEIEELCEVKEIELEILGSEEYSEKIVLWKQKIINQIDIWTDQRFFNVNAPDNSVITNAHTLVEPVRRETKIVKLPKLNISKFYGDSAHWLEFFSHFENAIHNNNSLTKIDKFNYLKSYLGGPAASYVGGFALTEANYDIALKMLKNRFGNKNTLIQAHLNQLLKLPAVRTINDFVGLRKFFDSAETQVRNLETLGIESQTYGNLLTQILLERIPKELVLEFNRSYPDKEYTFNDLFTFLDKELQSQERTFLLRNKVDNNYQSYNHESKTKFKKFESNRQFHNNRNTSVNYSADFKKGCVFCHSMDHDACEFETVLERKNKLKSENRCFRCFSKYHLARFCRAKIDPCKRCKSRGHHYLLCDKNESLLPGPSESESSNVITQCNASVRESGRVLLQTCSVVACHENRSKLVRVLLDNGSERTWITKNLANVLKVKVIRKERLSVYSFGLKKAEEKIYHVARLELKNRKDCDKSIQIEALIAETISAAPIAAPDQKTCAVLKRKGFLLADKGSNSEQSVDILIGADIFWNVINNSKVEKISENLYGIPTIFGFTLQGVQNGFENKMLQNPVAINFSMTSDIQMLWKLETLGICDEGKLSVSDENIINQFEDSLKYKDERYETRLLWKMTPTDLQNNFWLAKKRFQDLEKNFKQCEWVANEYRDIIKEQFNKGIIEECDREPKEYFMPHRAVVRNDKDTTKVRVVFNCSSKSKQNLSLNDYLEIGPNLNPNILDVILNFRKFKVAFNADIEKAFLMIGIAEEDRKYLKFLWFPEKSNEEYKIMRMTRLPFGCKSSPFILKATIRKHIQQYREDKPNCVEMLSSSLYVDDLFFGANTVSTAFELSSDAVTILKSAGMNLRKLNTNCDELRLLWMKNGLSSDCGSDSRLKMLGLIWNPVEDEILLDVSSLLQSLLHLKNTKRFVLHLAAMIFDPVGFVSPFVVQIKCLLQEIWQRGIDWDSELPEDLKIRWNNWCSEIKHLKDFVVARNYFSYGNGENGEVQVHIFCDASSVAYGAVAYFRYFCENKIFTSFIMAKGRVAPLKKLTLPRLELMAAVLGARLGKYLRDLFKSLVKEFVFWTDSLIVLYWIKGCAKQWKQFVSNRVVEIQEMSDPKSWNHCSGKDNPADLVSRGSSVQVLFQSQLWSFGPQWLRQEQIFWPKSIIKKVPEEAELEKTKTIVNVAVTQDSWMESLVLKYSSWTKILRIVAWCLRFISNLRKSEVVKTNFLQTSELNEAQSLIIVNIQKQAFSEEIRALKSGRCLSSGSKLIMLYPFLDDKDILRVGGRLRNSNLAENVKHPLILPKSHHITELIVKNYHQKYLHGGNQLLLSALRQQYWIIGARDVIRKILRKCVICCRYKRELSRQVMGDLPAARVNPGRVFSKTGIDFAGPFDVKPRKGRGVRPVKTYVCVFVCFLTKAVHLELVGDMTSQAFIAAFRRFISRRGKPEELYSDCGTNFVGASRELKSWASQEVVDYASNEGVNWKFNPPSAPHFGGLWEAAVKAMKFHMKRVIGSQILTCEEFSTFVTEIEACLNSRPLVPVSSDPDDYSAISPAHFLIGTTLKGFPEPDVSEEKISLYDRWKLVQQLTQSFWKKWSFDYLTQLQERTKWKRPFPNLKINDLVLIKDDHLPPMKWKMGRVTKVYQGPDGNIRVVELKTATGELRRPIQKLCLLPI